ncbi:hypothetical protein [Pontibacter liquoris]|uniref:hypothetical protein n=1 Tax=Pontibacter liquoris TaxID=2905677 RepID=UPI001FA7EDEA|nr:hypothetical protein [Pontibacter liquoris]
MKKLMMIACMMFGGACAVHASGNTKTRTSENKTASTVENKAGVVVEKRAATLSDKMVRELGLNNYQSRKVRELNKDVVAKKMAIEQQFAGNQALIDQKCKEVCATRDLALENVLSTEQYNDYFGDRKAYDQTEKEFMASLTAPESAKELADATTVTAGTATASIK